MYLHGKRKSALLAMTELAQHYRNGPLNVADLSEYQGASISYLEQIFCYMRRANLVAGVRGPGGGYILTRNPSTITIAEILDAVDKPKPVPVLNKLENEMRDVLHRFTLDRLVS